MMDMRVLLNLKNLAESGGTEGERRAARRALERLMRERGVREADLHAAAIKPITRVVRYRRPAEAHLLAAIGQSLGLTVYSEKRRGKRIKHLIFEGDPAIVAEVEPLFKAQAKPYLKQADAYMLGLAYSMFPAPPSEGGDDHEWTEEEIEAMRSGLKQGRRVSVRPELQNVLGE